MTGLFRRIRLEDRHPSDDVLLLSVEGELSGRRQRQVDAHLARCWHCRRRRERQQQTIGAFVDYLYAPESFPPPPHAWAGFEAKLHQTVLQPAAQPRKRASFQGFSVRYAAIAVGALLVCLWIYTGSMGRMSATQLLSRAEEAARISMRSVEGPVLHQKIRLRCKSRRARRDEVATAEFWVDRGHARFRRIGDGSVWGDLDNVLRTNGMDPQEPLSASAYARWRRSARLAAERVSSVTLPDGSAGWELAASAAGPGLPGQVIQDRLLLSGETWRPVENTLSVSSGDDVVEYEVSELAYDVQPRAALDASIFRIEPPIVTSPVTAAVVPAPEPPAPPAVDFDAAETEAHYTLHVLGLCRGGAVDVSRDANGPVVRGVLNGPEREQLLELLPQFGQVRVEVRTPEEVLAEGSSGSESRPRTAPAPAALVMPAQQKLEAWFRDKVPQGQAGARLSALAYQAVALAETAATESQALRSLLEAYPPARRKSLRPASQKLLSTMLEEHASAFDRSVEKQRSLLADVLDAMAGTAQANGSAEPGEAGMLLAAAEAERLTISLFTQTNDPPASVELAAARLRTLLAVLAGDPGRMTALVRDSVVVMNTPQVVEGKKQ